MKTTATLIIIAIMTVTIFTGCITVVTPPLPQASPSEVVETFASWYGDEYLEGCYSLMSTEYRNSTDLKTFKERINQCEKGGFHHKFVRVKSEKINGDFASVRIVYRRKGPFFDLFCIIEDLIEDPKTKTVNLVKEEDGWKLTELHCELRGK
ncbi:MAG: NTF2-like transpeptidase domain-containing protein [Candidatus Syntrophoarchaeum caldarius]|uniref:NTF2-like transpeptidase domain-containing protein n=1 Tax=Candidatus Syntropharchaeum caldarium TaxID=1838285 RepID=A0A1F2P7A0_9EURY|nr:MAG: NTF2-like transpeptidase domain-containing protein [Candidatus Syntrophoarchaeum caldarius]